MTRLFEPARSALAVPLLFALFLAAAANGFAASSAPIPLWPGTAPGDTGELGPERDTTTAKDRPVAGKPVVRLGNVSQPDITLFQPPKNKANGTAVLVCPGGGYHILAADLEGTEVCQWLNSLGVTGILLKYRVPKRPNRERYEAPLQDAQRAMGIIRSRAAEWGIATNRIGVLGFSAGGHLAALVSNTPADRKYEKVDAADEFDSRPDFAILVYPAYLTLKDNADALAPEMTVTSNTPPTFMVMAQDDPVRVETVLFYGAALRKARVPFELHVYPTGGHGYGLRRTEETVTTWPDRAGDWLRSRGLLRAGSR